MVLCPQRDKVCVCTLCVMCRVRMSICWTRMCKSCCPLVWLCAQIRDDSSGIMDHPSPTKVESCGEHRDCTLSIGS